MTWSENQGTGNAKKTLQALPSFCKGNHPVGQASPEFLFRLHPQLNHAKLHAPLNRPITTVQPLLDDLG